MDKTFYQLGKNKLRAYDNNQNVASGQGDDYTTSWLLDHNVFNKYYTMIVIDLSKQQALDADPRAMQQINLTGNLERDGNENTAMFFIIEEVKQTVLDFSQETVKVS